MTAKRVHQLCSADLPFSSIFAHAIIRQKLKITSNEELANLNDRQTVIRVKKLKFKTAIIANKHYELVAYARTEGML